jgi:hypothetical protein
MSLIQQFLEDKKNIDESPNSSKKSQTVNQGGSYE